MEQDANIRQSFFTTQLEQTRKKIDGKRELPKELEKAIGASIQPAQISALISHAAKAEEWLDICFQAERSMGQKPLEQLWVSGLEKFSNAVLYLENLGYFYFQKGNYHKALEYLARSHSIEKSFFAVTVAIASAYAVTQYHLVLDYFDMLSTGEKKKLDDTMLTKVATAALHQEKYQLSADLFTIIRAKNKVPELPSLEENLKNKFGSPKNLESWVGEMKKKSGQENCHHDISLTDWITFASALIHKREYDEALRHMETLKKERFGEAQ